MGQKSLKRCKVIFEQPLTIVLSSFLGHAHFVDNVTDIAKANHSISL